MCVCVCVCVEAGGDDWEKDFFQKLSGKDEEQDCKSEDGDDEDVIEMTLEPACPKVNPFKEAVKELENFCRFLESRGHVQAHSVLGSVINEVAGLKATTSQ